MLRPNANRALRLILFGGILAAGLMPVGLAGEKPAAEKTPPATEATPAAEQVSAEQAPAEKLPAALIPVSGEINDTLRSSVARRAAEAVRDGRRLLIFHITSNGGYVGAGLELSREIERLAAGGVRTLAFVDAKAYSAAAIAALSCQEIVMTPEASIGDCAPILVSPVGGLQTIEGTEREKMESAVRERMESLAQKNHYPVALARAMVTMRLVVVEAVNAKTGEVRYVEEEELFRLGPDWEKGGTVDSADELLTVGAEKAKKYGLAKHIVKRLDDLPDLYPIAGAIAWYPITWNETAVVWLNNMYLKALLVLVGLLGIYIELNTPGFGVPGIVGLAAFGLLFTAAFLAGRPDWLPPLLFVIGLVLLAVELFVTPGFGLLGGSGIVLILASIVLAMSSLGGVPEQTYEWTALYNALAVTGIVLAVFAVLAVLLARFFPSLPILSRLVLEPGSGSDGSSHAAAASQESDAHVGDIGRATTMLRPSGKARFGDRLVDVVADGEVLDAGTEIRVIEVRGNRIVVKAVAQHN